MPISSKLIIRMTWTGRVSNTCNIKGSWALSMFVTDLSSSLHTVLPACVYVGGRLLFLYIHRACTTWAYVDAAMFFLCFILFRRFVDKSVSPRLLCDVSIVVYPISKANIVQVLKDYLQSNQNQYDAAGH
ncbi:MAG: hypothetical protein FWH57_12200, partial [Oscillospiraceae bacterium]|nr:hypothetical protein [Oscillospiraceae bacterium]